MTFQKLVPFLKERLEFIEDVREKKLVTFANEKEWQEAKENLIVIQSLVTQYVNYGNADWKSHKSEIAYFEKFVNNCISHLHMAIDLFEVFYKDDVYSRKQYQDCIAFLNDLKDIIEEARLFTIFNEEEI